MDRQYARDIAHNFLVFAAIIAGLIVFIGFVFFSCVALSAREPEEIVPESRTNGARIELSYHDLSKAGEASTNRTVDASEESSTPLEGGA
jgi:hypothetical protein